MPVNTRCRFGRLRRAGNCGTCLTAIRSCKVDYLSEPGAPVEEGSCLACITIPQSKLNLDA